MQKHLKVFERNGSAEIWSDTDIQAGQDWNGSIERNLKESDIILFLVSANLIATDYVWNKEIPVAEECMQNKNATVIPVILNSCDWESVPLFAKCNVLPQKGKTIASFNNSQKLIAK